MNSQLIKKDKNVKYINKAKRLRKVGKVGLIENHKIFYQQILAQELELSTKKKNKERKEATPTLVKKKTIRQYLQKPKKSS